MLGNISTELQRLLTQTVQEFEASLSEEYRTYLSGRISGLKQAIEIISKENMKILEPSAN